jgi:hypothetical protein
MPLRSLAIAALTLIAAQLAGIAQQQGSAPPYVDPRPRVLPRPAPSAHDIQIEAMIAADRLAEAAWVREMTLTLAGEPPDLAGAQQHAAAVLRLRGERLHAQDPGWPDAQIDTYLAILLIDPRRFLSDSDFRINAVPAVAAGLAYEVPLEVRVRLLTQLRAFDFGLIERIEVAWGIAARSSRRREVIFEAVDLTYGSRKPIRASIYSLPSGYFRFEEAAAFLRSVHTIAPQRDIVVLSNQPLLGELRGLAGQMPLHLIDTLGRAYSPWPRDPFVVAQSARGPVTLVVRPNLQAQRELDVFMAREVVQNLPEELDQEWQRVQWTFAPVPFHGGHMLTTPEATWVSVHTLMPRIKELIGMRGPLDLQEVRRPHRQAQFLQALATAAGEFEAIFGRPVELVHAMPEDDSTAAVDAFGVVLGGGDARDLDSILTLVSQPGGGTAALVGDLTLGRRLLQDAPADDVGRLRALYHVIPEGNTLKQQLGDAQTTPVNRQFNAYLDAISDHLRRRGIDVHRVPLLHVPQELIPDPMRYTRVSFMISWNNVVLEEAGGEVHAEGFASGLESTDAAVQRIYAEAGVKLRYASPLALSIMRDGGYRCASNHVR